MLCTGCCQSAAIHPYYWSYNPELLLFVWSYDHQHGALSALLGIELTPSVGLATLNYCSMFGLLTTSMML